MITEIHMEDVACYKQPVNISPTNKVSLIYGLNGSGKSTITNYLYDLADEKYPRCTIKEDSEHEILVYNQLFLKDYFYEEDSLKGIFTLSKENKDVLIAIDQESKKLKDLEQAYKEIESQRFSIEHEKNITRNDVVDKMFKIKQKYAGGDRVLEYCLEGLKRKEPLFKHLTAIKNSENPPSYTIDDLKNEVSAIVGENAHPIDELEEFIFEGAEIEGNPIFEKVVVGSQEGSVAEFINNMKNSDWVRNGLSFLPENILSSGSPCPFCQEATITEGLVESIRGVFDDSYERDINQIKTYQNSYLELESVLNFGNITDISVVDKEISQEWKAVTSNIRSSYRENKLLIEKKIGSPSTPISLASSLDGIKSINVLVQRINELIQSHNEKLNNKQRSLDDINQRFWLLMRWKYSQTIELFEKTNDRLNLELLGSTNALKSITSEIESAQSHVIELRKKTVNIEEAIENINSGLSEIGVTGFSVIQYGKNLYRVRREGDDGNAFHSLSEGEKTVISFLYFIELCKGQSSTDAAPKKKIVVIDDPISSLSHIYVFNIGQLIKRIFCNSEKFEQVFLFTHSLYFFYELTHTNKNKRDEIQNLYRIIKNSDGSDVVKMKYEEIQNDYQTYWSIVKDEASHPALVANCMRNIIEYFFNFVQKTDFNNVFQKPLLSGDKYQAFSRYMNRESHSLGQNIFDIKEFDYMVFREGLRLVFQECGYSEHYKAMYK